TAPTAIEPGAGLPATVGGFVVTRTGSLASPLVVFYTVTGTATNGVDYFALPGSVTIPAGQASVPLLVTPVLDSVADSGERVVLTPVGNANSGVSPMASATVVIIDNQGPVTPPGGVVVSIVASDPSASERGVLEDPDPARFTLTRNGGLGSALTVSYVLA